LSDILIDLPSDDLAGEPEELVLGWLAHAVQSAADAAPEQVPSYIRHAHARLPEDRRLWRADHLKLLGAIGRAHASVLDYAAAKQALREATEAWFSRRRPTQASYALCEYLRLVGIARDASTLDHLVEAYVEPLLRRPDFDRVSRGYVLASVGRALVQANLSEHGLDRLRQPATWPLPPHLRAAILRWKARAHDDLGDATRATETRLQLEGVSRGEQRDLAAIDIALRSPLGRSSELAEGLVTSHKEARRLWDSFSMQTGVASEFNDGARVRRLVDEYRN
jgi:hypothetical protein